MPLNLQGGHYPFDRRYVTGENVGGAGCEYYVTSDGKTDNEARRASNGRVEICQGGFTGNTAVAVLVRFEAQFWVRAKNPDGSGVDCLGTARRPLGSAPKSRKRWVYS